MLKEDEDSVETVANQAAEFLVPDLAFFGEALKVVFQLALDIEILQIRVGTRTFDLLIDRVGNRVAISENPKGTVRVTVIKSFDRFRRVTVCLPREPTSIDWLPNGSFRIVF